jgi:hypothetical protein
MATWPITLPEAPLKEGYAITVGSAPLRSDMEVGPARVRRQTKSRNDKLPLSVSMSSSQVGIFRSWYDGDSGLAGGVNWFTGLRLSVDGICQTDLECRFLSPPTITYRGNNLWNVSFSVETR